MIYARIQDGLVFEVIQPMYRESGEEIPIAERFTPEFVGTLVDITSVSPAPDQRWAYDGSSFTPPTEGS